MSPDNRLTLKRREIILVGITLNDTYQVIADRIDRSKATISRNIKRNSQHGTYSAIKVQNKYQHRHLKSRR